MQPTNNLRVLNAHTSHSASPIQLSCLQCDRTFLSTWGCKHHLRTIHPLSTRNANPGNVSPNCQPSPPPPSSNPHSQTGFVDVPSPSSPSPGDIPSSPSSHVSSSTHPEQPDTPSTPSTRNRRVTIEDVTDDEGSDGFNASQRSPSPHYSYNHYFGGEPSLRSSSSGHEPPSVHSFKPTIKRTYHPDLTGKF